jgi:hypothetical protein
MPSARVSDGHLPIVKDQSRVIDLRLGVGVGLRCTVCHRRQSRIRTHAADLPCMASNPSGTKLGAASRTFKLIRGGPSIPRYRCTLSAG